MSEDGIRSPIREFISRSFEGQKLRDDDDIFALGFGNSLFAYQLLMFVENRFGIEIGSDDLEMVNFRSVESLSRLVGRKLGRPGD